MNRYFILSLLSACIMLFSNVGYAQDLKIMPMGNSLTYGWYDGTYDDGDRIGYRKELYDLLNANGYEFDFVGHQSTGGSVAGFDDPQHCGMPGYTDNQLANFVTTTYLNTHQPDVILLHIGTNDLIPETIDDNFGTGIGKLLNTIDTYETTYSREVLVFVSKIIQVKNGEGTCDPSGLWKVEHFNTNKVEPGVNSRINDDGDKLVLVDMQCGAGINYDTEMLNEYHPTQAGYNKMGQLWFDEIDALNDPPVVSPITVEAVAEGLPFDTFDLDDYVTDDHTPDADITWSLESTPTHYNVVVDGNNIVTVTPNVADWIGNENITFVATDDGNIIEALHRSASVTVYFETELGNDIPEIISQTTTFTVDEETPVTLALTDFDIEDEDHGISDWALHIHDGANYTVSGLTVTPEEHYDEALYVSITVEDILGAESDTFDVLLTYTPVNDEPAIDSVKAKTTEEDTFITLQLSDIYFNDPDDGDSHTIQILSGDDYTFNENTVYPDENFNGTLYVNTRLTDGELYDDVIAEIIVTSVNDSVKIITEPVRVSPDTIMYIYQVIAEDPDLDPITYSAVKPEWLHFDEVYGVMSGTPNSVGVYSIHIEATDGEFVDVQDFELHIVHVNSPPQIRDVDSIAEIGQVYSWIIGVMDADDEIEDIEYMATVLPDIPDFHFIKEEGWFYYEPDSADMGLYPVKIGVSDKEDTTWFEFRLNVGNVPWTGVEEFTAVNTISVYPNPANELLNITSDLSGQEQAIYLINVAGKVVMSDYFTDSISMSVATLPEGVYCVVILSEHGIETRKVLIQR